MGYRKQIGWITKEQYEALEVMPVIDLLKNYKSAKDYCADIFEEDVKENLKEDFLKKHRSEIISVIVKYDIGTQIYDFGKYVDFESKFLHNFYDKNFHYNCGDTEFYRVNKDFLEYAVGFYKEKVISQLKSYMEPFAEICSNGCCEFYSDFNFSNINKKQQKSIENMLLNIEDKLSAWLYFKHAVCQSKEEEKITGSWLYEYAIFELVRIYKSFDWENKVMYLVGG